MGDDLGLDQPVGGERAAGLHQVHDQPRQAERGRELHRAVELHHLRLHAAGGEVAAGDVRVLGGDRDARPAGGVVGAGGLRRLGHADAAAADAEVERRVDLGVVELHQHVGAADADLRRAMRHEGRDVEGPHPHHVERRIVGLEAQAPAVLVGVVGGGVDAGAGEQRPELVQDAALGHGEHERAAVGRRGIGAGGERGGEGSRPCARLAPRFAVAEVTLPCQPAAARCRRRPRRASPPPAHSRGRGGRRG